METPSSLLPLPPVTFHILLALAEEDRHGEALLDDFAGRLAQLQTHQPEATNTFLMGRENYPSFLHVMAECMWAQIGWRALQ